MRFVLLLFILYILPFKVEAQYQDTSKQEIYNDLVNEFYGETSKVRQIQIADEIIALSKVDKDTLHMVGGYYLKAEIYNDDRVLKFTDTIISLLENKQSSWQPSSTHILRGNYFYRQKKFGKALDEFTSSHQLNLQYGNTSLKLTTDYYIGILKIRLEQYEEAKKILLLNIDEFEKSKNTLPISTKHAHWFGIALSYSMLGKTDSASYYIDRGLKESIQDSAKVSHANFILANGINHYRKKNYLQAIKELKRSENKQVQSNNIPNLGATYYYLGLSMKDYGKTNLWIDKFKKVDSLAQNPDNIIPQIRPALEMLIEYYENKKNDSLTLSQIRKLLKFDSIVSQQNNHINNSITKNYDLPILLQKRQNIINRKNNEIDILSKISWIALILIVFLFVGVIYINHQKRIFSERYKKLVKEQAIKLRKANPEPKSPKAVSISQDVKNSILENLEKFEENEEFLQKGITLSKLSKQFGINSRYISIVVNEKNGQSFTHYINELRIEYAIERLKEDSVFRKYTIGAIAADLGFKQADSLNKAFFKLTGIKPSYFIKRLNQDSNNA